MNDNLIVGDQISNGVTMYTILKVNHAERYYHVITNYLTTAKLKFNTIDDRYIYCGHISNLDESLYLLTKDSISINNDYKPTVFDILNKTDLSSGNLLIELRCRLFQVIVDCNNRNDYLYRKFIDAYGDLIVDEITIEETDKHSILNIKVDYDYTRMVIKI